MQDFIAIFETMPALSWWLLLLGILAPFPLALFPHAKQRYYQHKLDRRITRDAYILEEELAEYQCDIGEELDEIDVRKLLIDGASAGILAAGGAWLSETREDGSTVFFAVMIGISLVFGAWRKANAPPEEYDPYTGTSEVTFPSEAIAAFFCAILFIAAAVAIITAF